MRYYISTLSGSKPDLVAFPDGLFAVPKRFSAVLGWTEEEDLWDHISGGRICKDHEVDEDVALTWLSRTESKETKAHG